MPKSKSTKMIVMRKTKSKYRHNANVSIQKQIGMSNKQIVKLRYASNTRLTGGVSNLRELQFRLNGLFDPDFSLVDTSLWASMNGQHFTVDIE